MPAYVFEGAALINNKWDDKLRAFWGSQKINKNEDIHKPALVKVKSVRV